MRAALPTLPLIRQKRPKLDAFLSKVDTVLAEATASIAASRLLLEDGDG